MSDPYLSAGAVEPAMKPHAVLSQRSQETPPSPSERLRAAGMRPTATRVSVLRVVETMSASFSANDVFMNLLADGTTLSIATIYRVLRDFESAELLVREWMPGLTGMKTMYSILYPRAGHRSALLHQLLCRRCGHSVAFQDTTLLEQLRRFAGHAGVEESWHCLTIETDDCHACRNQNRRTADAQKTDAAVPAEKPIGGPMQGSPRASMKRRRI